MNTVTLLPINKENVLLVRINQQRIDLIEKGKLLGLHHPTTVFISQDLDELIMEYQKLKLS
ncbi:aspartyl-phosphate phosphatase Spo0E family protein [Metabacillus litoralis]|uniref:aspartyl-phosphate phosphatase Spo0E family protein n=1 Tax=Metabacillus litoralis TaxID=152268 RepID=UPI001CFC6C3E|nr:aspartyl-phosphate phosphatase Spo0E family protein [Metabacillus litoralis]